jgi:hypothetical protein
MTLSCITDPVAYFLGVVKLGDAPARFWVGTARYITDGTKYPSGNVEGRIPLLPFSCPCCNDYEVPNTIRSDLRTTPTPVSSETLA